MHAKHRNGPGNGYRSTAMGAGGAAASRVSPEGSMRGHRMYNTEYRSYNRGGYGRGGHSRQFQSMPPPREADIFMEAGRLAAEYLVSKGMLSPDALSGKWQNDDLKGNFQGFRQQEVDKTQMPADGRASAHSRLGNAAPEAGGNRRRYSDEYDSMGSRNSIRGRKRAGSFKSYGSELNRELCRTGSWSDKGRASPGMEADSDPSVGHNADQPAGNGGVQSSSPGEVTQEVKRETQEGSGLEKFNSVEDAGANDTTLSAEKHIPSEADEEPAKRPDDANKFSDKAVVVKEGRNDSDLQLKHDENKEVKSSTRKENLAGEDHIDLVKHCKFVNVPTKARSSLTIKGSKGDQGPMNENEIISKRELSEGSGAIDMDVDMGSSGGGASSHQSHELKSLQSDVSNAPATEKELDVTNVAGPAQCMRSVSFPETSLYKEQEPVEGLSGFQSSNSMFATRGEKRIIEYNNDDRADYKKFRQWVPPLDAQSDDSPPLSGSLENLPTLEEPITSQSAHMTLSPNQRNSDISLLPKGQVDSCEFMEEKQLFPSSFKTCDLNLVGTCDANENSEADPLLGFPSVTLTGKVGTPIDVDLSMSNSGNLSNKNSEHGVKDNEIEVIDLENDSAQEHKTFSNPERRGDTVFTDLDGFPNNVNNANGIPDVQDGYGLMISELLANESPNCSSVPTDLNSLHNHMGLPNAEGMLGDDESIYMSLGEIPISLLSPWEQPSQDYGKPF